MKKQNILSCIIFTNAFKRDFYAYPISLEYTAPIYMNYNIRRDVMNLLNGCDRLKIRVTSSTEVMTKVNTL